jgi:hypothetical protein
VRRLLLGVALTGLTLTIPAQPARTPVSVAGRLEDCYYYQVDLPPYGQEARVCPPSNTVLGTVLRTVLPDV